jgi:hypothetical protein
VRPAHRTRDDPSIRFTRIAISAMGVASLARNEFFSRKHGVPTMHDDDKRRAGEAVALAIDALAQAFARTITGELGKAGARIRPPPRVAALEPQRIEKRFWSYVDKNGPDGCWLWRGTARQGYGIFRVRNREVKAHRYAYELCVGPIPADMIVMHSCDRRNCQNPEHLRPGTHAQNAADKVAKGRQMQGERHPCARLTAADVRLIRESSDSHVDLAKRFGVHMGTIIDVRRGKSWKHVLPLGGHASASSGDVVRGSDSNEECPEMEPTSTFTPR